MVYIALEAGRDDPQAIFESLNSTGKNLNATDLIRNFVLMDVEPSRQTSLYDNYWAKIEDIFLARKDNEFEEFTRVYLTVIEEKYPRTTDVYESFKENVRDRYSHTWTPEDVLSDFRDGAKAYANIHWNNSATDSKTESALLDYRALRLKILHPLLMRLATNGIQGKEYDPVAFRSALQLLESYLVRRAFVGLKSNSLDNSVGRIFGYMRESKFVGADAIADALLSLRGKARFPLDDEVIYRGQTMELYNSNFREHILTKLERQLDPNGIGLSAKLSIEHILPQKLTKSWENMLGPNAAQIRERLVHTIGNLTLTPYNSELGNRNFEEKVNLIKGGFANSKLQLSDSIVSEQVWGEEQILARGAMLMEMAVKAWPLPSMWTPAYSPLQSDESQDEISMLDLIREEIVAPDDELYWNRPGIGETHIARITESGTIVVSDGDEYESPTAATRHFTSSNYNGWRQWRHLAADGPTLDDLRSLIVG